MIEPDPEVVAETMREDWRQRVSNDRCPVDGCDGQLDTGWECNDCGFDAILIARTDGGTAQ